MLIGFNVNNREKQFTGANLINKMKKVFHIHRNAFSYSQKMRCRNIFIVEYEKKKGKCRNFHQN